MAQVIGSETTGNEQKRQISNHMLGPAPTHNHFQA